MTNVTLCTRTVIDGSNIHFGTSGARGLVTDFTSDVCQAFTHAFVSILRKKYPLTRIALGIDNRPSSGNIARYCAAALQQLGIEPLFCGVLPTPALAHYSLQSGIPCIMVTGSHIPFDRNGLKFYTPEGEIGKEDETDILLSDTRFQPAENSQQLTVCDDAAQSYLQRYLSFFDAGVLAGKKIGIYQHSSAGRDHYPRLFNALGAEVTCLERSDEFVPIDTEAVSVEDQQRALKWAEIYGFDAIFSTDGDGDRPLVADELGEWLRGDILGLLCAQALDIEALAIPVSCNSAVELCGHFERVVRTRIGSPYVIDEFNRLQEEFRTIAGFEANGGFLLGSDVQHEKALLHALPTRDAVLPALVVMVASSKSSISSLMRQLPARYTSSDRIKEFPNHISQQIVADGVNNPQQLSDRLGFSPFTVVNVDMTDGLRLTFDNGDTLHLRPSGNAPELRCYAESASQVNAAEYVSRALANIAISSF